VVPKKEKEGMDLNDGECKYVMRLWFRVGWFGIGSASAFGKAKACSVIIGDVDANILGSCISMTC
jgi:hypothetical protein